MKLYNYTKGEENMNIPNAVLIILDYRYLIRMKGNESNGSTLLLGDNKSVVLNYIMHSSFLKTKTSIFSFKKGLCY